MTCVCVWYVQLTLADSLSDLPVVEGIRFVLILHGLLTMWSAIDIISYHRYKVAVEIPLQRTLFRMLPTPLQEGQEIAVCTVLFTQGINEQQVLADR